MSSCTVGALADYADTVLAFAPHADGVAVTEAVAEHGSIVRGSAVDAEAGFAVAEHAGSVSAEAVDAGVAATRPVDADEVWAVAVDAKAGSDVRIVLSLRGTAVAEHAGIIGVVMAVDAPALISPAEHAGTVIAMAVDADSNAAIALDADILYRISSSWII